MLIFPPDLIPNYIKVDRLPVHAIGILVPQFEAVIDTVQLSGQPLPAKLTLQFRSLPTKDGWSSALEFYQLTKSGAIEFEFNNWQNAAQQFLGYSWRIAAITQTGNIVGDFDITIEQSRRYVATRRTLADVTNYPGNLLQDLSSDTPSTPANANLLIAGQVDSFYPTTSLNVNAAEFVESDVIVSPVDNPVAFDDSWAIPVDQADYTQDSVLGIAEVPDYLDDRGLSDGYEYYYDNTAKWYDIVN